MQNSALTSSQSRPVDACCAQPGSSIVCAASLLAMLVCSSRAAPVPDLEREIKAIFRDRCIVCHGPLKQKNGLRLDAGALIAKGGEHGAVVTPGKSAESA